MTHYARWYVHGSTADRTAENTARRDAQTAKRRAAAQFCSAADCGSPGHQRGRRLCKQHLLQQLESEHRPGDSIVPNLPGERWRSIVGHEGIYDVSDHGRVRSLDRTITEPDGTCKPFRGRLLRAASGPHGHRFVGLLNGSKAYVHRLVLEAFIGPPPPGMEGCHNDGDPGNNHASNLRWDTHGNNLLDATRHGTHFQARKTNCPRGHLLEAPNLKKTTGRANPRTIRNCLACTSTQDRQRYALSKGRPFDFETALAKRYAEIMGENADGTQPPGGRMAS